jgi:hypothetical protein
MLIDINYFKQRLPSIVNCDIDSLYVPQWFPLCQIFESSSSYSYEDIIDSLAYYRNQNDCDIYFNSDSEGLMIEYIESMDIVVKGLIEKHNIPINKLYYINGAFPVESNIKTYLDYCRENNFTPINLIMSNTWEQQCWYNLNLLKLEFNSSVKIRPKKFISMNGVPRIHRIAMAMLLLEKQLLNKAHYSFSITPQEQLYRGTFDDHFSKIYDNVNDIWENNRNMFPMCLTRQNFNGSSDYQQYYSKDIELFDESYFSLVQETLFTGRERNSKQSGECFNAKHTTFITEKTFRSILLSKPFIMMNRPYCMQKLQDFGYQTFHPYINESYDTIEDDTDRLFAILEEVERLCKLSDSEWLAIQHELLPRVKHNYNKVFNSQIYDIRYDVISQTITSHSKKSNILSN